MSDFPNPSFPNAAFGACFGTVSVGGSPTRVINGLTLSQYVSVVAPTNNKSFVWIGDSHVAVNAGFQLAPGDKTVIDTGLSRDKWYATTDGTTAGNVLSYMSVADA